MTLLYQIRQVLHPLISTPLHPQWLVLRERLHTKTTLINLARGKVLDIGCGDRWSESVINTIDSYTGLDFPPTVNMGYNGKPDVFGDAQSLPFADESFDTVLLLDVLEHLPEPERALLEARRVLKTNGNIITQVPFLYPLHDEPFDFHRWTLHALNALFLKHGIQVREITHHGNPVETATALLVIALTKGVIDSIHQRHFGLLLVPLLILSIPIINVVGWLLGRLLPNSELMPLGYRILGTKL